IVMVHGGNEYNPIPSPGMMKRYRGYIDAGASAVIAMHTHCPQGYEYYQGSPIIYSLGNFLFDTPYPERKVYEKDDFWWKGYIALLTVNADKKITIKAIPIDFGPDGTAVSEIKGDEAIVFAEYLEYISELILNPGEVQKYWHAWCMMKGPWWVDHFNNMHYPFDRGNRDKLLSALALRNGHTCEAHNEIITTFLKLAAHGNDTGHDEYIRKIDILQKGRIP
ncbi:MAG: CapA family protein, partial [Clostridia bacterium]|nr:CapA family protein [Clostridia bacterium]